MGVAIGAWQGFWIAYIRIPAFIVTLAGMMLWRGLSLITLNGLTISPFPEEYLKYFTNFLPVTGNKSTAVAVTLVIGVIISVIYILPQIFGRVQKIRREYQIENGIPPALVNI